MNDLVEKIFPIMYLNIVKKYIERVNKIVSEYDVVIFMARKAICFYDALVLQKYIDKSKNCCVISSRALDYNILEQMKNKKIALIDDFVVRGTSITKSMLTLQKVGIEPDIFIAACEEKFIEQESFEYKRFIDKTFVELSYVDICRIAECITEFIEASMCPYNIDQPIYKIKFNDNKDVKKFVQDNKCTDISSSKQKMRGIVNKVIHFNSEIFCNWTQQEVNRNGLYIKLRFLYKQGGNEVIILPFIVMPEITYQKLDKLYEIVRTPALDNILNNQNNLLRWENKLNLFQYIFSNFFLIQFLKERKIEEKASKIRSNELAQFSKCLFEDEDLKSRIESELFTSKLLLNEEYAKSDMFVYNDCVSYTYDYIFSNEDLECRYIDANNTRIRGKLLTCEDLETYIQKRIEIVDNHVFSNLIDIFIDRGVFVPAIVHTETGTIVRGYRCGEVAKLTEEELSLFSYALGIYLDSIQNEKDYLDKIEFEKLCVLFFRRLIQKVFTVVDALREADNSDYYEIAYSKFGPRVSLAKGKRYSVGQKETLADEMMELLLLGIEKRSEPNNGEIVEKYVVKDNRKSFSQDGWGEIATLFGYQLSYIRKCFIKSLKYTSEEWKKYVSTYNKFLTLLAIGNNEKEQMLSLAAEINLFYSVKTDNASLKDILKRILVKFDGICSGVWKHVCFKNSILEKVFNEMLKYNKENMLLIKIDYMTLRVDKNKAITEFIGECGDFLVYLAYSVYKLCKKYGINGIDKKGDLQYVDDMCFDNIINSVDSRYNIESNENEDLSDILELKREATALLDICDIFLEEDVMNIKRIKKCFVLYSISKEMIRGTREYNGLIENKNANVQKYNYIIIKYAEEVSFESQLASIIQEYAQDNLVKIIYCDFNKEYEGIFVSSLNLKGNNFDKVIGDIIQHESSPQLDQSIELLCYSATPFSINQQKASEYVIYETKEDIYKIKNYNSKKFKIFKKKENGMHIGKVSGEKVIIAESYYEKFSVNNFEILDVNNLDKLKQEITKLVDSKQDENLQMGSQQVLDGINEKSKLKIEEGLKVLGGVGKGIITSVAGGTILAYMRVLGILPPM